MNRIQTIFCFLTVGIICGGSSCESKKAETLTTTYTEADSLTEIYLDLQDSILLAWNLMINDDNQKIKAMQHLLHELKVTGRFDRDQLQSLEHRVAQLRKIRYTPKSLKNSDVIDEYDFASNSLVSEIITLAESYSSYSYNTTMQNLVEQIRTAEQRVENYRLAYDGIVLEYNRFLTVNKDHLHEIELAGSLEKKPLFQMVSE